MTAAGEEDKVTKATGIIKFAVIGLIIILSAYSLTHFVLKAITGGAGGGGGQDTGGCCVNSGYSFSTGMYDNHTNDNAECTRLCEECAECGNCHFISGRSCEGL